MIDSYKTPARELASGMGQAVADRTILRKVERFNTDLEFAEFELPRRDDISLDEQVALHAKNTDLIISSYTIEEGDGLTIKGTMSVIGYIVKETWADVANRVALGSSLLQPITESIEGREGEALANLAREQVAEFNAMNHHLRQASTLMSGRHLQHGDETQPERNIEVFTNCSTSAMSFLSFYLLLNGSGVGRAYDDEMMLVDWNYLPLVIPVIDYGHKDVQSGEILATNRRDITHFYKGKNIIDFEVADSREGWTKAFEKMEYLAFTKEHKNSVLIMDFSKVRERGAPIKGMQNRPASGPGPMMKAVENIAKLRGAGMAPWRSTMFADHFLAECVLVGGARRAARMATKYWKDKTVLDFISVKQGGFLWSSNNSVTVDQEFWTYAKMGEHEVGRVYDDEKRALIKHAQAVFEAVCSHSYHDGTGEPGFINVDKLTWSDAGIEALLDGEFAESEKLQLSTETLNLSRALAKAFANSEAKTITNPCGEIVLGKLGGYCVIADVVPYYAQDDADAEDAFRVSTRALIRTNLMDALYGKEVKRTNRIGVGMTGLHEYAWKRFGYGFRDIINEEKSQNFWLMLARFKRAVQDEAKTYSAKLGVSEPHTNTTMKPAGTTSKLFGLTEGAHLPSMREYMRWVQFRNDDPLIAQYEAMGYPVKRLITYSGTTVVGFPTSPEICTLGMGDKLVTAAEATPEEQYQYLRLLEKYWITGVEEDGVTPLEERGNQVSYTLKYAPGVVSYDEFKRTLLDGQSTIRCCSVMPQTDGSAYEYQPEQPVSKAEYELVCRSIEAASNGVKIAEDVGIEHVACEGGACPISFDENQ